MIKSLFLFVAALVLLSICSTPVRAAEITLNWRKYIDSTQVNDLKFMPNQDQFIVGLGFSTEVRSCDDGEKIIVYPFGSWRIEFSTDSNKIVTILPIDGYKTLQLRSVENMELLKEYILPPDEEGFGISFQEIKVDPVRPYIYALWSKSKHEGSQWITYDKILIFNSETLEPVGELMPQTDLLLYNLAVSKDGKYLAVMNAGYTSKLMVWSLDTRQQIIEKQIGNSGQGWSDPRDVKFSEINTDKIYFTGQFYQPGNAETLEGLCIFSISQNKIMDSTFALDSNRIFDSFFLPFEKESKIIASNGVMFYILDLIVNKKVYEKFNLVEDGINSNIAIYNEKEKYFIGAASNLLNKFQYQPNTSVPSDNNNEVIYPNPTNGLVNIPINCQSSVTYKIFDINGILIKSNLANSPSVSNLLTIDCSDLLKGVYTIQIICDKYINQYQIVKGE